MKIRVDDIKDVAVHLKAEEGVESFASLAAMQKAGECEFVAPVSIDIAVSREYDHFRAHGRARTRVRLACSRCLASYEAEIDSGFTVFYSKSAPGLQDEEEIELAEEDLVSVTFDGDEIDFSPEIEEQVMMEIPFKPLCREECAGLCQRCGADLNQSECGCDRGDFNIKFSVLKNFKAER